MRKLLAYINRALDEPLRFTKRDEEACLALAYVALGILTYLIVAFAACAC